MSNEKELQKKAIATFKQQGYDYLGSHISEADLANNFFTKIIELNSTVLPDGLSEDEKKRLWNALPLDMRGSVEVLLNEIVLTLDNNKVVKLKLLDRHNVSNNSFQVTEEVNVHGVTGNRLDVIVIINGVPLSNLELKARGNKHGVDEAINQINRYAREGVYSYGLMKFVRVFTVSNDIVTKYFAASPRAEQQEPYKKAFYWTDQDNKPVHDISIFIENFYRPDRFLEILTKYIILTPQNNGNDALILRPYQYFAVLKSLERLESSDENGFIWHATGSGKTLTSYVLASSLAMGEKFHKVVMLLDRNDLATQTIDEFSTFSTNFVGSVSRGRTLHAQMVDKTQPFVMTTVQSFSRWLNKYGKTAASINKNPMCFVVDECHRTTFGTMFKDIKKTFDKSQFVGFTGTPRLAENPTDKDFLTKDIFGEPIHVYTTKNAISDKNVLPFSVKEVTVVVDEEVKRNRDYYRLPARMSTIANHIVDNLWKSTEQKEPIKSVASTTGYTAMLASQGKREAYLYWKDLTAKLSAQNRTTALVYSITDNAEDQGDGLEQEWYLEVLEKHDENFKTDFANGWKIDKEQTRKKHLNDVITRVKNKEIDLLVVSDMLLTGFNAPTLNTLYLDKPLDYHNLLQAMSRTNRTHASTGKQYGNVTIFSDRDMSADIDDAILLFSNGENVEGVVERKLFKQIFLETVAAVNELKTAIPEPAIISSIEDPTNFIEMMKIFSSAKSLVRNIQTYDEWETTDWKKIGISSDKLDEYYAHFYEQGKHFSVDSKLSSDILEEISFHITHISEFKIDVVYINELLRNATYAPKRDKDKWVKKITNAVNLSDDPAVVAKKEAILKTAEAVRAGNVTNQAELEKHLRKEQDLLEEARYLTYSADFNVEVETFKGWVEYCRLNGSIPYSSIDNVLSEQGLKLFERPEVRKQIVQILTTKFN